MHLIQKTVSNRFTYYWNAKKQQWEGLRDNGTKYELGSPAMVYQMAKIIWDGKAREGEIGAIPCKSN